MNATPVQGGSFSTSGHRAMEDLTARARIRDAALLCFAREGFRVPLRTIAEEAGVSVPLITHHYKTKDALRQTCDDWVLDRFLELKLTAIHRPESVRETLADTSMASVLVVYMIRSFLDQTTSARPFFERYREHLRTIIEASRRAGLINPASDEEERLHILAAQSIGNLLVEFVINPHDDPREFVDHFYTTKNMEALIELYSQAFFTSSPLMDSYLESIRTKEKKENHV